MTKPKTPSQWSQSFPSTKLAFPKTKGQFNEAKKQGRIDGFFRVSGVKFNAGRPKGTTKRKSNQLNEVTPPSKKSKDETNEVNVVEQVRSSDKKRAYIRWCDHAEVLAVHLDVYMKKKM